MTSEDLNNPEEEELWSVLLKTLSGRMKKPISCIDGGSTFIEVFLPNLKPVLFGILYRPLHK